MIGVLVSAIVERPATVLAAVQACEQATCLSASVDAACRSMCGRYTAEVLRVSPAIAPALPARPE